MIYRRVTNPRFVNAEKTLIDCDVIFPHLSPDPVPYTSSPDDAEAHCREIFKDCLAGKYGPVKDFEG